MLLFELQVQLHFCCFRPLHLAAANTRARYVSLLQAHVDCTFCHACSLQQAQLAVFQKMQQAGFNQDVHSADVAAASGPERTSDFVTGAAGPGVSAGGALAGGIVGRDADDISATAKARSSDAAAPLSSGSDKRGSAVETDSVSDGGGGAALAGGSAAGSASGLSAGPLQQSSGAKADGKGAVSGAGHTDVGRSAQNSGHRTSDDIIQQGIARGLIRRHSGGEDADISERDGSSGSGGSNAIGSSQLTQALSSTARGDTAAGASGGAVDELGTGGDADEDFADKLLARATAAGELFAAGGGAASGSTAAGSERSGGRAGAVEDLPASGLGLSGGGGLSRREADSNADLALPGSVAGSAAAKQQQAAWQHAGQQEQPRQQQLDAASSRAAADTGTAGSAGVDEKGTAAADAHSSGGKSQSAGADVVGLGHSSSGSGPAADAATGRQAGVSSGGSSGGSTAVLSPGPSQSIQLPGWSSSAANMPLLKQLSLSCSAPSRIGLSK
jgi:hypothetical protein